MCYTFHCERLATALSLFPQNHSGGQAYGSYSSYSVPRLEEPFILLQIGITMGKMYSSEEKFISEYQQLSEEGKYKAEHFLKNLHRLEKWQLTQEQALEAAGIADIHERKDQRMINGFYGALRSESASRPEASEHDASYDYLRCSFCGKYAKHVEKMVQGPHGVRICNECIRLCSEIISEGIEEDSESPQKKAARQRSVAKEMLAFMHQGHILGVEAFERETLGEKPENERHCFIYANTGNFCHECLYSGTLREKAILKLISDAGAIWTTVDYFVSADGIPNPLLQSVRLYCSSTSGPQKIAWARIPEHGGESQNERGPLL